MYRCPDFDFPLGIWILKKNRDMGCPWFAIFVRDFSKILQIVYFLINIMHINLINLTMVKKN